MTSDYDLSDIKAQGVCFLVADSRVIQCVTKTIDTAIRLAGPYFDVRSAPMLSFYGYTYAPSRVLIPTLEDIAVANKNSELLKISAKADWAKQKALSAGLTLEDIKNLIAGG